MAESFDNLLPRPRAIAKPPRPRPAPRAVASSSRQAGGLRWRPRAASNTLENFVLFVALALTAHAAGADDEATRGAQIFFWARLG